jgi:rhodanese-related sulfurtransferase
MKKLTLFLLLLSSSLAFSQILNKDFDEMLKDLLAHSVNEIGVEEVNDDDENTIFLDAREKNEYEVSHIKNAIWIGYNNFKIKSVKSIPKEAKIIVYCSVGYRSEKISEKLVKSGYTNVYNLYGSIFEWVNQGNAVYDMNGKETLKVHAYNKKWGQWLDKGTKVYK